ncbi:MAG: DNA-binding response regulator [Massilia sp.]|nr:DNA-binding response regulator [Massilia sp.]
MPGLRAGHAKSLMSCPLARGVSTRKRALGLSVRTVETHRLNIERKLGIEGQAELIRFAVQHAGFEGGAR